MPESSDPSRSAATKPRRKHSPRTVATTPKQETKSTVSDNAPVSDDHHPTDHATTNDTSSQPDTVNTDHTPTEYAAAHPTPAEPAPSEPEADEHKPTQPIAAEHDVIEDADAEDVEHVPDEPRDPLDDLTADPMLAAVDPVDGLIDVPGDDDPDLEALADVDADVDPLVEDEEDEEEEELPKASNRVAPRMPGHMPGVPNRPVMHARLPSKAEIFVEGDHVVYPTHGVGKVERIATEEIAGHTLELIHITFEENRMTLRVPVSKARSAGLRKLATRKMFDDAMAVLKGRARIKRTMWSRRAQEYEAKINSGDPLAIAEVVRDLHRNAGQPDQSFSERQIYEAAMDRLAAELAALDKTDKVTAVAKLGKFMGVP
jgi:CarD family transcriptional regulator